MLLKKLVGATAVFLVLFGIHWTAILAGVAFGALYYLMPERR
jgi:hypothetical protein